MAPAYLEDEIDALVAGEILTRLDNDCVQTAFVIQTPTLIEALQKLAARQAEAIYPTFNAILIALRSAFDRGDLNSQDRRWGEWAWIVPSLLCAPLDLSWTSKRPPKRKDGGAGMPLVANCLEKGPSLAVGRGCRR